MTKIVWTIIRTKIKEEETMNYFAIALLSLFIFALVYTIIDRICRCIEYCSKAKAIGKLITQNVMFKPEEMEEFINEQTKWKNC